MSIKSSLNCVQTYQVLIPNFERLLIEKAAIFWEYPPATLIGRDVYIGFGQ